MKKKKSLNLLNLILASLILVAMPVKTPVKSQIDRAPHISANRDDSSIKYRHIVPKNVTIIINTEDNNPLSVDMPLNVTLEVTHTEPGVKGNTATNATKPATLETGAIVNVPLFINTNDMIRVDTREAKYIERVK